MTDNPTKTRRKYHVGMWLFLLVQAIFVIWIITGIATSAPDCSNSGLDVQTCKDAAAAGTAVGVGIVFLFWAVVDVILGMVWLVVHFARKR